MIYLVSNSISLPLFPTEVELKIISVEESLDLLNSVSFLQFDSETSGLDPHIKKIKCIQFGSKVLDAYIVIDVESVDIQLYKTILETKYLIAQNAKFDLKFLYSEGILPTKIYDTMIVEQFLNLGVPNMFVGATPEDIKEYYTIVEHYYNWETMSSSEKKAILYSKNNTLADKLYKYSGFSLASIAKRYLNIEIDKSIRGDIIWRGLDLDVIIYAAKDVMYLEDIMELQLKKCKEINGLVGAKLECDFVPVIAYLEWCGVELDETLWQKKMEGDKENLNKREQALNNFMISIGNEDFLYINNQGNLFTGFDFSPKCTVNWSSSQQVIKVAKFLGFNTYIQDKKTGEDKASVVEKHLKGQKGINDEFLSLYFAYQESAKLCSTYGQTYINAINPKTGRIHTVFKQLGASSSRMACGDKKSNAELAELKGIPKDECKYVQLQTLPADHATRSAFIAGKDRLFCSADYSGLEARLGADIYQEQSMIYEFLEGSGDIHSLVARACFSEIKDLTTKEIKEKHSGLRKRAKPVGFAVQFGGSAYAIKDSLNCTLEEAEAILQSYMKGFPGISTFKSKGSKFVKNNGYIIINSITGHRLNWWDWKIWKEAQLKYNDMDWAAYRIRKQQNPGNAECKAVSKHFKVASKYDRLSLNTPGQGE